MQKLVATIAALALAVLGLTAASFAPHLSSSTLSQTYVGAWAGGTASGYAAANAKIGPLASTKVFYQTLPATWAGSKSATFPAGTVQIIAWNTPTTNVVSFAKSIPPGQIVGFSYQSEAEGAYSGASGAAQFVSEWEQQANLIRTVGNPDLLLIPSAEAYQYTPAAANPAAAACDYMPPAQYVDYYGVDVYQHEAGANWPSQGLANYAPWLDWMKCVPKGAGIAINEYGVDATVSTSERAARFQQDASYLSGLNLFCWIYWYGNTGGTTATNYVFTDAAAVAAWQAAEGGAAPTPTPTPTNTGTPTPTPTPTVTPTPTPTHHWRCTRWTRLHHRWWWLHHCQH